MSGLLPADLRLSLPALYANEHIPDPMVRAKLFTPWTNWTWYVLEFDGDDICFGLVDGHETELGYFSISELEAIRGPGGLKIERDEHFVSTALSDVKASIERLRSMDHPSLYGHDPHRQDRER